VFVINWVEATKTMEIFFYMKQWFGY